MKKYNFGLFYIITFMMIFFLSSCFSNKEIASFQHLQNNSESKIISASDSNFIESSDILQILLGNLDEQTQVQINSLNINGTYKIDNQGMIDFPFVGKIKAIGISKENLKFKIEDLLIEKKIAKNPLATVKITNFHVTILGEVSKPGLVNISDEQITLPELLGLAGDLTVFAKRKNILLIREQNGIRTFRRFSLNDSITFEPYFYNLKNRDIIYIEPNGIKAFNASQSRSILGFTTGVLTLVILIMGFTR
ncbi:MAG: polysaccharide biosynthesis/export family protein [Bacteroidia bacterium]